MKSSQRNEFSRTQEPRDSISERDRAAATGIGCFAQRFVKLCTLTPIPIPCGRAPRRASAQACRSEPFGPQAVAQIARNCFPNGTRC